MATHLHRVTFDLDGVLIDSRAAVIAAYHAAGVTMPPDAWGEPFESWMDDGELISRETIRQAKQDAYPVMLARYATALAGTTVARALTALGITVDVVTNASPRSARDALAWLNFDVPVYSAPVFGGKAAALAAIGPACHVDDFPVIHAPVPVVAYIDDPVELSARIWRHL